MESLSGKSSPGSVKGNVAARESVRSRLAMLFFSQVCLLAAVAGVSASRHPVPGCVFLGLVWLLDLPRSWQPVRMLVLALAFIGAMAYAGFRGPSPPPVPAWLAEASAPAQMRDGREKPPPPLRVRGKVLDCTPLSGGRLRILLGEAVPVNDHSGSGPAEPRAAPYQGRIAWTWYRPEIIPLPGQVLETALRLAPVRGMKNPGGWDVEQYWRDRGVWFRAWSGARSRAVILEAGARPASMFAEAREKLLYGFLAALPGEKGKASNPQFSSLSESAAILPALIFGDRSFLSEEQTDFFARSTLAHSLALSGLHLGYATLAGLFLAYAIGRLFPRLWLYIPRPAAALLFALPLAAAYLWLGKMPVSLMRAACMLFFWTLLLFLKRPRVILDGLLATVAVLLLLDPLSLFDLSLQLSVISVATIALCLPFLYNLSQRLFPDRPAARPRHAPHGRIRSSFSRAFRRLLRWSVVLLGTSFCIQIVLSPITARVFGTAGLWFPLNLLWLPALGFLVMPPAVLGLVFSGIGMETAASTSLYLAALPCEALMRLLHLLEESGWLTAPLIPRPHWLSAAGFWLLCLSLPGLALGRGKRILSACFVLAGLAMLLLPPALALYENRQTGVRLRLLDVGQGQAVLVEWSGMAGTISGRHPDSGRVLVDGGGFPGSSFDVSKSILAPVLTDNALPRLDMVINTHPDADHLAGLVYLLEHAWVGSYLGNGDRALPALEEREQKALPALEEREQKALRRSGLAQRVLKAGDRLELARDLRLEVLWPPGDFPYENRKRGAESGNNASLILRLVWKDTPLALLCGDAEAPALLALMDAVGRSGGSFQAENVVSSEGSLQGSNYLSAQVLVLPHHGSAGSLVPGFYETVGPRTALASCGHANKWGFPSAPVRSALKALGIPLHATSQRGQIQIIWRNSAEPPEIRFARQGEESKR